MTLAAEKHGFHHAAPICAQHAAVIVQFHAGGAAHHQVDNAAEDLAEECVLAILPNGADDVVALVHLGAQRADFFGRILQVRIKRHHDVALRGRKSAQNGVVLTVVTVE